EVRPNCLSSNFPREEIAVHLLHLENQTNCQGMAQNVRKLASSSLRRAILVLSDDYQNDQAVTMLRAGATEYLGISSDLCKLRHFIDLVGHGSGVAADSRAKSLDQPASSPFSYVLSTEMIEMMDQVWRVAPQDTTLFLTGETGTGKTQLARLIHE